MTTVILTGGKSSRMGADKATLNGSSGMISTMLADRFSILGPVLFSVGVEDHLPDGDYRRIEDKYPGMGPLNGLFAAFECTEEEYVLLVATDMPFADPYLAERLEQELGAYDACAIVRKNGRIEPLFAVYTRNCLKKAEQCMSEGRRSLRAMLSRCSVRLIGEEELPDWNVDRVLFNMNTPQDYQKYRRSLDIK
ncbi:MAG: molybdenum cofactor guanylyltransferase [Oscillospiraceae bacterium]